jgi:hypothetical protein
MDSSAATSSTSSSKKATASEGTRSCRVSSFVGADDLRRTVRGAKLAANQDIFQKTYGTTVEIVAIDDLIKGDFTAALQGEGSHYLTFGCPFTTLLGVDAVIHVASPQPGRENAESIIDVGTKLIIVHQLTLFTCGPQNAVLGSTNILCQAIDTGIKRFSVASSIAATMDFTKGVDLNWASLTEDGVVDFASRMVPSSL